MVLLLSRAELARLLDPSAAIRTVEAAFGAYTAGETQTPPRVSLQPDGQQGVVLVMPCAIAEPAAVGTKIVSVFPDNPRRGLPRVTSLYLLNDPETGAPLAVMDGGYLTGLRTAAGSAVATRYLARVESRTLGVFGTGVQARFHVEAIRQVWPIELVRVSGSSPEKAEVFAREVGESTGLPVQAESAHVVSGCDLLAVCTTSPTPVVVDAAVRPGTHINAVGAFVPTTRELPGPLVGRARVFADTRAGVLAEAGDVLLAQREGALPPGDPLAGELGEVILGRRTGRVSATDVTVYKSVGAAFLDAATARLAYMRARERRIGQDFAFT